jgi:anti-sigma factor RsiW
VVERSNTSLDHGMDHRYIDEHAVAARYLDRELTAGQRAEFEAHLVDCQECVDRVLLAEMFHSRNGAPKPKPEEVLKPEPGAVRVRVALMLRPWQFILVLASAVALLVLVPSVLIWIVRR